VTASTKRQRRWGKLGIHLLLVPFLIFALFPFYHMGITSLKTDREMYDRKAVPPLIKQEVTFEH
jgi:ABC-type glycerol-3-phosphate transport system permease component